MKSKRLQAGLTTKSKARRPRFGWVALVCLSVLPLLLQTGCTEPVLSITSPPKGTLLEEATVYIDVHYSNGQATTFGAYLNGTDITSQLTVTATGANGLISITEEGSLLLQCHISNEIGTTSARSLFFYSSTGYGPGVTTLTETEYTNLIQSDGSMEALHDDVYHLHQAVGYNSEPISRIMYDGSDATLYMSSFYDENSLSHDNMVDIIELEVPWSITRGQYPRYLVFIQERPTPTSIVWYNLNSSYTMDFSDPENPTGFTGPIPVEVAGGPYQYTSYFLATDWSATAACMLSVLGALGSCVPCVAAPGPGCLLCAVGIGSIMISCGTCDMASYVWCN